MITAKHLTKSYGNFKAVDDLSFSIEEGHIYGFLGPNGAGKSTTLNIITGCLAPSSGEVMVDDYDIYESSKEAKKLIGYLPEIPPLYFDQTPREYLSFVVDAKKIPHSGRKDEIERVAKETNIENVLDKPIKYLSKGYKQRVGISQALVGDPKIVILDEPTVGLDPMQILEIRELILELGKKHTVILSSHILSEVQTLCDKVLIIYKGKMVAFDAPENLEKSVSSEGIIDVMPDCSSDKALEVLNEVGSVSYTEVVKETDSGCSLKLHVKGDDALSICKEVFKIFVDNDIALFQLNLEKTTLEDIFLELTKNEEDLKNDSGIKA